MDIKIRSGIFHIHDLFQSFTTAHGLLGVGMRMLTMLKLLYNALCLHTPLARHFLLLFDCSLSCCALALNMLRHVVRTARRHRSRSVFFSSGRLFLSVDKASRCI